MVTLFTLGIICLAAVILIPVILFLVGLPFLLLMGLLPWLLRLSLIHISEPTRPY